MKRKRNAKRKPKKIPVVGANEAFFNADHSGIDDLYNAEFVSRMEAETPQAGTSKSVQQSGLGKQEFNETTENNTNTLAEMNIALSSNLSKKAGSSTTKLSRGFASSNMNLTSDAGLVQGKRTCQTESILPHQDPRYKKQELNAALLVIKKIMEMDAAEAFNVPVDPIALGIPDYFDVIDTPMDFGTICNNLEKGHKYMNSEDVFKDVQYIWENCCKYNKKGDYIMEVMKRMKKNFMKYWTAAGLYKEQPLATNGQSCLQPPAESTMRHSTCGHRSPMSPMTGYINQQQHMTGTCLVGDHQLSHSCCHACQPQVRACQCQSSSSELQPSHSLAGTNTGSGGNFNSLLTMCTLRCSSCFNVSPVMTGNASHQQQHQMGSSQIQAHQCAPSHSQLYQPHQSKHHQSQSNACECQLSQPESGTHIGVAVVERHSQLPPPMEFTMRSSKCEQKCLGGLVTDNLGHQQQDHPSPCQVQSHQPSSTYSHAYQPQQTSYQCPPSSSKPQASLPQADVGSSDSTPVQRRTKGRGPTRCLKLWRDGKRISVTINELGQPIGPEAQKLTSFLGTLARDGHLAPLTYINWKAMPDANKENMWQQVPPKFDINPKGKTWVLKSLGKKWKDWKAKLKAAHYITHTTDEERLADRDERVLPDQWSNLILHWNSEEVEKRSATNRANRAQQKFNHTTGQKSFARIREEQRAKRPDGKEPSRAELFILTRTRKNGEPVNEASSALIERLRERATQQQETSQNSTVQEDIFSQVMGEDRHGPIRNFGLGPSPSDIGVAKPTRAEAIRMVSEANAEVREVKQRMVAMEQTCAQMAAQMATMMSMMSNMQTRFPDKNQTDVVANTSNGSEGSPQHQVHSTPSCHVAPSYETRARKKGKMQNARAT